MARWGDHNTEWLMTGYELVDRGMTRALQNKGKQQGCMKGKSQGEKGKSGDKGKGPPKGKNGDRAGLWADWSGL